MVSIDRTASYFRPYTVNGRTVKNIHFYLDEGVVLTIPRGWLETEENRDIVKMVLDTDKVATKRKQKFDKALAYVMTVQDCGKPAYDLYIHASLVGLENHGEVEKTYNDHSQFFTAWFMKGEFYKQNSATPVENIMVYHYERSEKNDWGKKVAEMAEELESKGINLTSYDVERLLKNYDLVAK